MIVCIDTNVVLQARASGHPYFPILDACVAGRLSWAVSTGILLEYEEIVSAMSGEIAWRKLARLMDLIDLTTRTLLRVNPHFQFRIIGDDPDDNTFTDCAVSAEADYIITEDRHFAPLAKAGYKPMPISPTDFIAKFPNICRQANRAI